jgi:hypothetical protein
MASRKNLSVKKSHMMKFCERLSKGGQKLVQDNAQELIYKSGMMGPGLRTTTTSNKRQKTSNACSNCGLLTQQRSTSQLCQKNPSRFAEEEVVVIAEDKMGEGQRRSNDEEVAKGITGSDAVTNNHKKENKEHKGKKKSCPSCRLYTHR